MMRVIFLLLVSSIALQSKSQTWNNYLQKRFKSYGIWADSVLLVPNDTSLNKTGFAIKGSTAYIGDGVKWTAITGGSSVVDSLVFATKANVIKVRDSLGAIMNTKLAITDTANKWVSKSHTINNISNGTGFLKNNGSGTWSYDNNSYVDLSSNQTITGAKTVTNNFKIKDDNGIDISDTKLILENARTTSISDTIAVAPYILFTSKSFISDPSGDYTGQSNNMEWRIRQTLAKAGKMAGQDSRLFFDYKNGNAGSWVPAVSISKDGVQGNITGVDQMTLGNFSGNTGKITFKNVGGYTAGSIQAFGNVLRVSDGGGSGRIEFFNGVVYYGGSATSTGSQLSSTGWALTKNANTTFTASALLHLAANKSTAGNASLKFTLASAALLSTKEIGAFEAVYDRLYFTDSTNTRNTLAYLSDVAAKQDIITGGATSIVSSNLTADRALVSNGSGKVATSSVTATELGYVGGVTSSIQTQLNAKLTTANSNVKRYIRVDSTTYSGNYAMDGTKEVVLIDYADPCNITLPAVASLPDGSVFEIQFYNWAQTNKQVTVYPEGTDSETIDKGFGISGGGNLLLKSNPQANSVTPLSLRIMWMKNDNIWTVLQGGVFDY